MEITKFKVGKRCSLGMRLDESMGLRQSVAYLAGLESSHDAGGVSALRADHGERLKPLSLVCHL